MVIATSMLAWIAIWAFWLITTRHFHPSNALALIVTTSLVGAFAAAITLNHLILIPRFWRTGRRARYVVWLGGTMLLLNAAALTVIRTAYFLLWGPDADPNGVYKHFAIDLFGMAVHVAGAALLVWGIRKIALSADRLTAE